jgi:hypothetical protein
MNVGGETCNAVLQAGRQAGRKMQKAGLIKFKGRIEIGKRAHVAAALRLHSTEKLWREHEDNAQYARLE